MPSAGIEEFLTWLAVERGRAHNTLAAYRRDLTSYERWLATRKRTVDSATTEDIQAYIAHLRSSGLRAASVARSLVAIRSFYSFGVDEGLRKNDPAREVERPRVPQGVPKALSEEEVTALLEAVVDSTPMGRRDRAILELLYGTGVRISELVGLSLSGLSTEEEVLRVFGKGSKERLVPLGRYARQALDAWLSPDGRECLIPLRWARKDDSDAVFLNARGGRLSRQGAWAVVRKYGDRVGLGDRLTPHVLRHSCATHMLDHGADIRVVQELLGHSSISTTQVYTKVTSDRIRHVYESAHPRAAG